MTAVFTDKFGTFEVENVINIHYDAKDNIYNVMFADYSEEEYCESQLVEINMGGI